MEYSLFDPWLEDETHHVLRDGGVSFLGLDVSGSISSSYFQHTFTSYLSGFPFYLASLLRRSRDRTETLILCKFCGVVQPGEMLLVLGRPGSGCSTFLKTIAGDAHGTIIHDRSAINYRGTNFEVMHKIFRADSIYVSELDVHFPELKVGETLSFAASMRNHKSSIHTSNEVRSVARQIGSIFGLASVIDTRLGDEMIRGVSGGEKKRVSIAEAYVSGARIQCWDNSTRGLDSMTALQFVQTLRRSANSTNATVLMSIYQSLEAMYNCFDKIILLYEGQQIYFGSTKKAAIYFEDMGFVRPPRATTADFLTSLTSPTEQIVQKGYEHRVPRSAEQFAQVWRSSSEYRSTTEDINRFNRAFPLLSRVFSVSTYRQINGNLHRAFARIINNPVPTVSGIVGNAIAGVILGSVFNRLPSTTESLQPRSILLFYSIMINACTPAFEVLTMWAQRPIVEKQSRYAFYGPPTEYLSSIIMDLPNKVMASFLFNIPIYFMTQLRRTAEAFFTFYLFSFLTMLTMSMFFRMVGSLSRTIQQAMTPVSNVIMLFIIYAGFVIPPGYMVPWLGWIRWINPIAYAYESLMVNEFENQSYQCTTMIPTGRSYGYDLKGKVCSAVGSRPGEPFVLGAEYLKMKYGYATNHLWRNLGILLAMLVIFGSIHLLATNYILAARSKGEVLLYRHGYSKNQLHKGDVEADVPEVHATRTGDKAVDVHQSSENIPQIHLHTSVFHWSNLNYEVKHGKQKKKILNDMNGWMKPGTLTALMGATGAGKTSLLDVLRGRRSVGLVTGEIHIDDFPRDERFQRHIAYVQQNDLHLSTATVREALQFSALLRQPKHVPEDEKMAYVERVLDALDLQGVADAVVGVPGEGLNVEQRKRLTIGVELAAKPELLLFLDEPTSGLDSQAAFAIISLLRKLADSGQTIMCTIHQPSSQLFQFFDRLLLLQHGHVLYFGEIGVDFQTLIGYFQKNGAEHCKKGENPAEWMMRVTGATDSHRNPQSWIDMWSHSKKNKEVKQQLEGMRSSAQSRVRPNKPDGGVYALGTLKQLQIVLKRQLQEYWRDPTYLYAKLSLCAGAALLNGLSFYNISNSIQGLISVLFSAFLLLILFSSVAQQIIPRFIATRTLFNAREKESMTYSWVVFILSNVIVEVIWQSFAAVLVFACWYYPTGMWRSSGERYDALKEFDGRWGSGERQGMIWCLIWLFMLFISGLSHALAAGISQAETVVNIAQLLFGLSTIFCGILVFPTALPRFWIFMYRVSPFTYLISGLAIAGLADTSLRCNRAELVQIDVPPDLGTTCGAYLQEFMALAGGYIEGHRSNDQKCLYCPVTDSNTVLASMGIGGRLEGWRNVGILLGYVLVNFVAIFGLYWVVFQRVRHEPKKP
ncbi:hypothetical protein K458DRAFT_471249 [Lentithecium fluviatile CBS 122367]|uniref:ABC transporter domain-containing protein n=1 Tax=Lentithecium fluviatile CBS 122367 TaxID=1168545 RepID=A0A6G1IBQ5_9PLEO|nr:hypothetical protein K458DRAFT_471249 [Lentithecium fluviatile CBS 122367]